MRTQQERVKIILRLYLKGHPHFLLLASCIATYSASYLSISNVAGTSDRRAFTPSKAVDLEGGGKNAPPVPWPRLRHRSLHKPIVGFLDAAAPVMHKGSNMSSFCVSRNCEDCLISKRCSLHFVGTRRPVLLEGLVRRLPLFGIIFLPMGCSLQ